MYILYMWLTDLPPTTGLEVSHFVIQRWGFMWPLAISAIQHNAVHWLHILYKSKKHMKSMCCARDKIYPGYSRDSETKDNMQ